MSGYRTGERNNWGIKKKSAEEDEKMLKSAQI